MTLSVVPGLGPRTIARLAERGVHGLVDLIELEVSDLAEITGFAPDRALMVQRLARARLAYAGPEPNGAPNRDVSTSAAADDKAGKKPKKKAKPDKKKRDKKKADKKKADKKKADKKKAEKKRRRKKEKAEKKSKQDKKRKRKKESKKKDKRRFYLD